MAAQERSKGQPSKPADLLNTDSGDDQFDVKPPAFDEACLPPPPPAVEEPPPPAFDAAVLPKPQATFDPYSTIVAPPPLPAAPEYFAPPPPSAPVYEDLMESAPSYTTLPPPVQAPSSEEDDDAALAEMMGLQHLSPEERKDLIAEQKKIMASIEQGKSATASSRADAFESRSHQAAVRAISGNNGNNSNNMVMQGAEHTREAIAQGTAIRVQCLSCDNWMQVTQAAELMFCPTCQTVCPVLHEDGGSDDAKLMQSDMQLAEQLQKEEYKLAEQGEQRRQRQEAARKEKVEQSGSSWSEWLGLAQAPSPTASSPERPTSFSQPATERGGIGVARPPGSSAGLMEAQTDSIQFSSSSPSRGPAARVAERQPLFNCVADSITSAATSFSTALNTTTLAQDGEGNVHGVDSSSLLSVPMVGRDTQYEQMNDK
jgi:hypothetical protein